MASNTHRANCAHAQNPGCVCSGCGGAWHGWQGWVELADDMQQCRDDRRSQIQSKIERNQRTGALSFNARNRQAFVDLARLDLTDHLSATSAGPTAANQLPEVADPADPASYSSDKSRLSTIADAIMADTWPGISAEIDEYAKDERTARDIKRQLADHTWCGLLIALVRCIEKIDEAAQLLSDTAKRFIKRALTEHLSGLPRMVADTVVGIVVDKVWSALAKLLSAHFPLLGEDTLRVLRILALFTCPSVEQHPEVYKHAAKPLMGDGLKLVSDEIKGQVTTLFAVWWQRRSPETTG